jgi:negative regulator of sigma-B (phosphoserine phosphatase)
VTPFSELLIAHETRPKHGEIANGDVVVVRRHARGVLLAIVDALGHGPRAEVVARLAAAYFEELPPVLDADAETVMRGLHAALQGTRGAAATVCLIRGDTIEGCGVGNVELRCVGAEVPVVLNPGIVGVQLKRVQAFSGKLMPRSRCFLFSDGVSRRAPFSEIARLTPEEACTLLIAKHRHTHDDASIAVVAVKEPD